MRAGSAAAYERVKAHLGELVAQTADSAHYRTLGNQFLWLSDTIGQSGKLAEAMTSTTRSETDKHALIDKAFGGSMESETVAALKLLSSQSWSAPGDFAEVCAELGLDLIFKSAEADKTLHRTQEDLFFIDQTLRGNRELRDELVTRKRSVDERIKLAEEIFSSHVCDVAMMLLRRLVAGANGGRIIADLMHLRTQCAVAQGKELAVVRSAQELSEAQFERLSNILLKRSGRPVAIDVVVDPSLIGGMRIRMGAELYEGTLAASLQQARTRLAG